MNEQYKTGDIVEVLDNGTAGEHMKGVTARVVEGNEDGADYVFVEDPTGGGLFTQYGDTTSWIIDNENLRLNETKQEETPVKPVELKVGDTVRVLKSSIWHTMGETGKVTEVTGISIQVNDWWISTREVELVTEKPKARSQEISVEDVREGDTVVAFWNLNGVEYRQKGTATKISSTGYPLTAEGNYIVHTGGASRAYSFGTPAEHIYLIERPEAKGFDALDKTKKYLLKGRDGSSDYVLAFEEGNWKYGWVGDNTRVNAKQYEKWFTEGNGAWDKPVEYKEPELADGTYWVTDKDVNDDCWWKVEVKDSKATWGIRGDMSDKAYADYDYLVEAIKGNVHVVHTTNPFPEPTNLEKFERAGVIGNRYRSGNVLYKVTKKGKVKGIIMGDAQDSWQTVIWDFETFQGYVDSGLIRKIS